MRCWASCCTPKKRQILTLPREHSEEPVINLFFIGSMKSGTSTLSEPIEARPVVIFMPSETEPAYFVDPSGQLSEDLQHVGARTDLCADV